MSSEELKPALSTCEERWCDDTILEPILFYCADCGAHFCDLCWYKTVAHRPKPHLEHHRQHEKTNQGLVQRMNEILRPTDDQEKLSKLHEDDEHSTWFGMHYTAAHFPAASSKD